MGYEGCRDQYFGHTTYSQHGEDLMFCNLAKLFNLDKPTYLDLGAHHPVTISNTALLYQRGARGVNVEANPNLMDLFYRERPQDVNVNVGIGAVPGVMEFFMVDEWSGLNSFSKESIEKHGFTPRMSKMIPVITLNTLVDEYCHGEFPDFLFTDLEGFDLKVLETADFSKSKPKIICSELRKHETLAARALLLNRGYYSLCRMGENMIFVIEELIKYCS